MGIRKFVIKQFFKSVENKSLWKLYIITFDKGDSNECSFIHSCKYCIFND